MVDAVGSQQQLHKILLAWDYFDLWRRCESGGGVFEDLKDVPKTFSSFKEYQSVMEPLLLEECCAQIMRGVEEGEVMSPHPAVVASHEHREDFLIVRLVLQAGATEVYTDNDLVLICKENPEAETQTVNASLHALGFCEAHEGQQVLRVKFYLVPSGQACGARGVQRAKAMSAGLCTPSSCWWLLRLGNISTITREWTALQHAHLVPFIDILISARSRAAPASKHLDIPPGMRAAMERDCNPSQMSALQAGLDGTPVVLIQGPPGTGKTRTILNLLSVIMNSAHKTSIAFLSSVVAAGREGSEAPASGLAALLPPSLEDRERLHAAQCPWLYGDLRAGRNTGNCRDDVTPYDPIPQGSGVHDDCFGLLRRVAPHRLGRNMGPKAHVLVCAPSNSALDEIVMRILRSGLMDKDGANFAPSLVRVGVRSHHSVSAVSLDNIVDSRLGAGEKGGKTGGGGSAGAAERDRMRVAILDEANIVCSTLSFAGSSVFYRLSRKFDVVVIDEAAQAVEPSTLVPMVMGCKQVYLVGDPVQLPATVIATRAVEKGYDCSLFKRLQTAGYPVKILDTQYRMHPEISAFPSLEFYEGRLLNGEGVEDETTQPWHSQPAFGPFAFFDIAGKESTPPGGASIMNKAEVHMVLVIYRELVHAYPQLRRSASVAVISPYKAQVKLLRDTFRTALGEEAARLVDINTIDGFQGREKDICIFSAVRSPAVAKKNGRRPGIGFVADERRINVGITRARCSLIVIGNIRALQVDGHWANLIHSAITRRCLYRPKPPYANWMADVLAGTVVGRVEPTAQEMAALEKSRARAARIAAERGAKAGEYAALDVMGGLEGQEGEVAGNQATAAPGGDGGGGREVLENPGVDEGAVWAEEEEEDEEDKPVQLDAAAAITADQLAAAARGAGADDNGSGGGTAAVPAPKRTAQEGGAAAGKRARA
ncbi:hypothetical protein Vafri_6246 [Volvox africanus]|uniref:Uncharacterized protein n=2 Tax=Volvox africanus TaxID=51714 RepID=A0A8J4AZS0_9CHLO|nr:hypothetical protein Vafri_6246 [Volvox africanus]